MQYHVDGDLVPADAASVNARDRGFLFGDAVSAGLRAFGGSVFAADAYENRLASACDRLGIAAPEDVLDRCRETLSANDLTDARLRVTVSRGTADDDLGLAPGRDEEGGDTTVLVTAAPTPRGGTEGSPPWDDPATLQTVKVRRPDDRAVPADLGAGSRLSAVLARRELVADADEALLRGPEGSVVGGAASNVCYVAEDGLHTPGTGPVSPGVVRSMALEFAAAADVPIHEDAPTPEDVRNASEAFLTSAHWGIRPVDVVDGIEVGGGPLTELVRREYERRIEAEYY